MSRENEPQNEGRERHPLKIAVGGIIHEANTFAPGMTGFESFQDERVAGNEAFFARYRHTRTSMGGVIDAAMIAQAELSCGFFTNASAGGALRDEVAEDLMQALVESLDISADGYVLILHGAVVAQSYPDVEGEILRLVRKKVGSKPIAMTLDLHANISQAMIDRADLVVGYDTYPHIDVYERALEAFDLLLRLIRQEIKPVRALAQPRLLVVPNAMMTDSPGPMREIMARAFAIETDPLVLSVTVAGGFAYSDVPDAGIAVVVTTNGDEALARQYADELKAMFWDARERFQVSDYTPEAAAALAFAEPEGPVVLIECADNLGGGAPADGTHMLKYLINPPKKSLAVIRDPEAVRRAISLGVGETFEMEVGGKTDTLHGAPVLVKGTVKTLFDCKYRHIGSYMTGMFEDIGRTAVIEAGSLTLMLTEKKAGPWDVGHVVFAGIRPELHHVILVKAAIAWKTAFGDMCKREIVVDSPGCCTTNLKHLTYRHLRRPIYPLDAMGEPVDA